MLPFKGKVALVTGASRGIGRAIALRLARGGADVGINYVKNEGAAKEVAAEIEGMGRRAHALQGDVGRADDIKRMFTEALRLLGHIDIVVSNAAGGVIGPTLRIGKHGFGVAMDVNARALLLCAQEAAKAMEGRGGKIVAISSIGSARCLPGYAAVGASKAAIEALTRYLAVDLAPKGINVNAVSAGPVQTEALKFFRDLDAMQADLMKRTPAGRIARPEEIASVVAFLCSDDAGWIHGQTIVADGGLSLL